MVRILICWTVSNTLIAWSITMVGHVKKCYGGLACPMVLWTQSAWVSGVVSTCADWQRFWSSSWWWFLSCCMAVRHGHWTLTWRSELLPLVIGVSIEALHVTSPRQDPPWWRSKHCKQTGLLQPQYIPVRSTATAWRLPASASNLMAELFAIREDLRFTTTLTSPCSVTLLKLPLSPLTHPASPP